MESALKLKIVLDETRMLVLGAQILLGFQLRAPFEPLFAGLAPGTKLVHAANLMLITVVVGMLIAPAIHHRQIDEGHFSWRTHGAIRRAMEVTLALFAVSLTLAAFAAFTQLGGARAGWIAAFATLICALALWFGLGAIQHKEEAMGATAYEHIPLPHRIDQMLTEARVVLPGAQALLGFQLVVVLTEAFERLPQTAKAVHAVALACLGLSTMLLMAPAAYHRIVYHGEASPDFLSIGSRFLVAATVMLALAIAADIVVVVGKIAESEAIGALAGACAFIALFGLWHVSPLILRRRRDAPSGHAAE